jgi:hypothetical protein
MVYFHVSDDELAAGTVLKPGLWGRKKLNLDPASIDTSRKSVRDLQWSITELRFEAERKRVAPDAPSRFDSIFLWERLRDAETHVGDEAAWFIYSVSLDELAPQFRGDHHLLDLKAKRSFNSIGRRAFCYWSRPGEGSCIEVFSTGRAEIVECVWSSGDADEENFAGGT